MLGNSPARSMITDLTACAQFVRRISARQRCDIFGRIELSQIF
jgi:hypothetical protein